ncbi:hypothetical protein [Pedobacter steynii]
MNKTIANHLRMFEAIIGQILRVRETEENAIGIGVQLYCTFTELSDEVYNLLLGNPDFAAKEMEGGLEVIDYMIGGCNLLHAVYSSTLVFNSVER